MTFEDKIPGVMILWLGAIGTAAVLATNVARTRLREMEKIVNAHAQEQTTVIESATIDSPPNSQEFLGEQKS